MDPLSIGIIGGVGAIVSTLGGVFFLVKELFKSIKAERAFRSTVRARAIRGNGPDLSTQLTRLLESDLESKPELVKQLTELVSDVNLSEEDKKVLLSGLQQPSAAGQQRYAEKLYAEMNEAVKASASH